MREPLNLEAGMIRGDFMLNGYETVVAKSTRGYYKRRDCVATCLICGRKRKFTGSAFMNGVGTHHKNCGKEELIEFDNKYPEFRHIFERLRDRTRVAKRRLARNENVTDCNRAELEMLASSYDNIKDYINFYDYFHEAYLDAKERFGGHKLYPWLKVPKDGIIKGNLEFSIKSNLRVNKNVKTDLWQFITTDNRVYIARSIFWICQMLGLKYTVVSNKFIREQQDCGDGVKISLGEFQKIGTFNTKITGLSEDIVCMEVGKPVILGEHESYATITTIPKSRYGKIISQITKAEILDRGEQMCC